jgi:hypothetical protein
LLLKEITHPPTHKKGANKMAWLWCRLFFCHSFCTHRTCSTFIFSFSWNDFLMEKEKNKRAAPTTQTKTYAKKTAVSYCV